MSFKRIESKLDKLVSSVVKDVYEIAKLLHQLVNDKSYLELEFDMRVDDRDERLARWAGVTGFSVNDLVQMYDHFSDRSHWESGRLDVLRDETCKALLAKSGRRRDAGGSHRGPVSRALYDDAQREIASLKVENERLKKSLASWKRKYRKLEKSVAVEV